MQGKIGIEPLSGYCLLWLDLGVNMKLQFMLPTATTTAALGLIFTAKFAAKIGRSISEANLGESDSNNTGAIFVDVETLLG